MGSDEQTRTVSRPYPTGWLRRWDFISVDLGTSLTLLIFLVLGVDPVAYKDDTPSNVIKVVPVVFRIALLIMILTLKTDAANRMINSLAPIFALRNVLELLIWTWRALACAMGWHQLLAPWMFGWYYFTSLLSTGFYMAVTLETCQIGWLSDLKAGCKRAFARLKQEW